MKRDGKLYGDWVRETRENLRWSQERLAKEAVLSTATIVNTECHRHKNGPRGITRRAIERAFMRAELDGQSR